jgi:Cu+-exporting ATPase
MATFYSPVPAEADDTLDPFKRTGTAHMATTVVQTMGMTCSACTSAVESAFKDVEGAGSVSASLAMERTVVQHDPNILPAERIAEIIEDRGFDAEVLTTDLPQTTPQLVVSTDGNVDNNNAGPIDSDDRQMATTVVSISGMTCGACTSAVEGGFSDVDGVAKFNISLLAERAVITHDPSKLSTQQIVEIIEDRGFDAEIISSQKSGHQQMQAMASIQLKIYGLPDRDTANSLEDILRQKAGVLSAVINLSTSRATINYKPSLMGLRALVETVEEAGFNALVADSEDNNAQLESLAKTKEIQEWRRAFWFSLSFAIPVFCISMIIPMAVPALDFGSWIITPGLYLGDLLCMGLTFPVQFGIGKRFYISAWKSLKHKSPTMDVLVVLGTSAAWFFSVAAMLVSIIAPPHGRPATVFDTSTMLITFITLGRWLENRAKGQTSKALSRLMSLAPSMATIYDDPIAAEKAAEGWEIPLSPAVEKKRPIPEEVLESRKAAGQKVIPTELIQVGDIVILRPGDKVPADGTVTRGESYVDEGMVTGEAMPILKRKGNLLMAGTVNGAGRIDFRVTRAGRDTQLSQIVKLVQEAQTSRAPIQRMADVVAGYFVPTIIALGLTTFISWMILSHVLSNPPTIFTDAHSGGKFMVCLKLCISVIVFACPCALGLSTPTAVMVGTGVGAEHGILVKGGATLETATKITHVVLDKTGTLTMGKMSVSNAKIESTWTSNEWRKRLWWSVVGLAELGSEHPVGKAILTAAKENLNLGPDDSVDGSIGNFEAAVGKGIFAEVEPSTSAERTRYRVHIGNAKYLRSQGIRVPESADPDSSVNMCSSNASSSKMLPAGVTTVHTAIDSVYAGTLSLSDSLKPTAAAAITALHRMGISTSLVTGDTYATALSIARAVGIPKSEIHASVSPSDKQSIISSLQSTPNPKTGKPHLVAMVGDGINDSPGLATADIGISLSSGTDIAIEAADIVLMQPLDLLSIPASLSLARTIFNRIKLNLMWACVYNVVGLPFAMGIFLPFNGWHLHPMMAGAAMAMSSVSVVGSSLLLRFWKRPGWMKLERLEGAEKGGLLQEVGRRKSLPGLRTVIEIFGRRSRKDDIGYVPLETVEPV